MRKFNFIKFILLQLFLAPEAWACGRLPTFQEIFVIYAVVLLFIWLFIWAIYYIIRGLLAYKGKNLNNQNLKTTYFLPALLYFVFSIYIVKCLFSQISIIYIGYILYIVYCCGYQVWAYIKQILPKKWAWICPIIPFYYMIISNITKSLLPIFKTDNIIISTCLSVTIYILIISGIYKYIDKQKTSILKIIWGLLLALTCIYNAYILYGFYAHNDHLQNNLMCDSHFISIYEKIRA